MAPAVLVHWQGTLMDVSLSFSRLHTSLVSTSLPIRSCVIPSTPQSVVPSSISTSLVEPIEPSQRTMISRSGAQFVGVHVASGAADDANKRP